MTRVFKHYSEPLGMVLAYVTVMVAVFVALGVW